MRQFLGFGSGVDGVANLSGTDSPIDATCTGTAGQTTLSATNASFSAGQMILIHQTYGTGAGQWELNKISSYSAGTITLATALENSYITGAQVLVVKEYSKVTISNANTRTGKSYDGSVGGITVLCCSGDTTIDGTLEINGTTGVGSSPNNNNVTVRGGFRGGGGWRTTSTSAIAGDGTSGLRSFTSNTGGNGGGAGGQSGGDSGAGGGGNGTAGNNGASNSGTPGIGGTAVGTSDLTNINMGGGGGGGRTDDAEGGHGGSGGGIVIIFTKTITVNNSTGLMQSIGGNGYGVDQASGGGGAGGSILIKTQQATIGTNRITATGGAGGSSGASQAGGAGGSGRIRIETCSLSGSTNQGSVSTAEGGHNFCASGTMTM